MSATLLKKYVRLMLETVNEHPQAPFELTGVVSKGKSSDGNFAIYREFPLVVTPELAVSMGVPTDELVGGNILDGEHEIIIDVESRYHRSTFKGNREQPPDPDEFEVEGWSVVSIDGLRLDPTDAKRLYDYLDGELTEDEMDRLQQDAMENQDEGPDPDDYYDSRFDRDDY